MSEHIVNIFGAIGEFEQPNGLIMKGVTLLDVVSQVNSAPEGTTAIRVRIDSPGGVKDTGDQIYNYLVSLKSKYQVTTEQVGMVASIATKVFGAGDVREALDGETFMIHNPWTSVQGDAAQLEAVAQELKASELDLLNFYKQLTGVPEEGLIPLLNNETEFDAQTALKLHFATKINPKKLKIAAMKIEDKTMNRFYNQFVAFLNKVNGKVMNMVAELADGTKLFLETEDLANLLGVGAYMVDANGNPTQEPAPDGTYQLKDGRTITVSGGEVTAADGAQAAAPEPAPAAADVQMAEKIEALTLALKSVKVDSKEEILKAIDEKFVALRSELKVKHTPRGFNPENSKEDAMSWDKAFKENRISAMKKNDPDMYQRLFFAKYGKMPNM